MDPIYARLCSEKTVQSDKNGFFAEFFEEVYHMAGSKWIRDQFGEIGSDHKKMLMIFNDPQICDIVLGILEHVKPVYKEKDAMVSYQKRLQGEKAFLMEEYKTALLLLNQAVIRSPAKGVDYNVDNGNTLALALWCRAAVLLKLGDGERALDDLKQATLAGFNTKLNPEYYWRQTHAYALMGDTMKAKISLAVTEKLHEGSQHKIEKLRKEFSDIEPVGPRRPRLNPPTPSGGENSELSGASKYVQLLETRDKGKFIAAKENVKTGDIVLVEKPVAACLLPTVFGSHCHHCFQRLYASYGCPNCSGVAFCSPACVEAACSTYHKYECEYLDLMIGSGMSILCFIAVRIFTQAKSVQEAMKVAEDLISNHCTHSDKRKPEDFLQRGLMASFLMRCLQKCEYFGRRPTEAVNPTERELKVASLLLGLLQVVQFNAHEIYEVVKSTDHRFDGSKTFYIGAGIYRVGSYFNHDCCPGLLRYFVGSSIVLASSRPVIAGEPVSENYGPIFTKMSLKERQKILSGRYWFDCACLACRENWPGLDKLEKNVRFKCTTASCSAVLRYPKDIGKDVRCSGCRKNISLKESVEKVIRCEEMYRDAAKLMKEEKPSEAIKVFAEAIDMFHECAVLPHKDTVIAQETLRTCFADSGNSSTV